MKSFYVESVAAAISLSLLWIGGSVQADDYVLGEPTLLPAQVSTTAYYGQGRVAYNQAGNHAVGPTDSGDGVPVPPGEDIYQEAMQSNWSGCESCTTPSCCQDSGWFGSASALLMTRDDGNRFTLSRGGADNANRVLDTRSTDWDWYGGFDVHVGRYFNGGCNGLEVVYSGLYPSSEEATVYGKDVPGGLKGAQEWFRTKYNGKLSSFWVDRAAAHRVRQDFDFHNVELNFLSFHNRPCSRWNYSWLAGVRYVRFDEELLFSSSLYDSDFDGDRDEFNQLVATENNLIGFQIGGTSRYWVSQRLSLNLGTKLGVYGNHIRQKQFMGGTAGPASVINIFSSEFGQPLDVDTSTNDLAFLGELNLGMSYRLTRNLNATIGYRAMAVTGVALTSHQLLTQVDSIQEMELIDSNGSLILHGGYAGLEWSW